NAAYLLLAGESYLLLNRLEAGVENRWLAPDGSTNGAACRPAEAYRCAGEDGGRAAGPTAPWRSTRFWSRRACCRTSPTPSPAPTPPRGGDPARHGGPRAPRPHP